MKSRIAFFGIVLFLSLAVVYGKLHKADLEPWSDSVSIHSGSIPRPGILESEMPPPSWDKDRDGYSSEPSKTHVRVALAASKFEVADMIALVGADGGAKVIVVDMFFSDDEATLKMSLGNALEYAHKKGVSVIAHGGPPMLEGRNQIGICNSGETRCFDALSTDFGVTSVGAGETSCRNCQSGISSTGGELICHWDVALGGFQAHRGTTYQCAPMIETGIINLDDPLSISRFHDRKLSPSILVIGLFEDRWSFRSYGEDKQIFRAEGTALGIQYRLQRVEHVGDCDDIDPEMHPSAPEVCDDKDNDCDGIIDDGAKTSYALDEDGDGVGTWTKTDPYGDKYSVAIEWCSKPSPKYVEHGGDCNDADPTVYGGYPEAPELCDGKDNDCDKVIDQDDYGQRCCGDGHDNDNDGQIDEDCVERRRKPTLDQVLAPATP